jgi:tRNA(Ser,Leu) C12 N-acetylase TAN1
MQTYYNTNNLDGKRLVDAIDNNTKQEDIVLMLFKKENRPMSASMVYELYDNSQTPLTSIRRAMTNLMTKRHLKKTDSMVMGLYGKKEHLYALIETISNI